MRAHALALVLLASCTMAAPGNDASRADSPVDARAEDSFTGDVGAVLEDSAVTADVPSLDANGVEASTADAPVPEDRGVPVMDVLSEARSDVLTDALRDGAGDVRAEASVGGGFEEVVSRTLYEQLFPNRNALYSYDALVRAAAFYPTFCNEGDLAQRRREAAAFLANISHETTGGWDTAPGGRYAWGLVFTQEVGCETGRCTAYCDATNTRYPCAPGRTYHGRGPMQLSWNYNYGFLGEQLRVDLLGDPDLLVRDGTLSFRSAVWFWMTAQAPKPSAHDVMIGRWIPTDADRAANREPGFGMTINIINGGLECGRATTPAVQDRVGFYQRYTMLLGVDPGTALFCDRMRPYSG